MMNNYGLLDIYITGLLALYQGCLLRVILKISYQVIQSYNRFKNVFGKVFYPLNSPFSHYDTFISPIANKESDVIRDCAECYL